MSYEKLATADVQALIKQECTNVANMLCEKNRDYGNSAFQPIRIFSTLNPIAQLDVRIDDKLSRIVRGRHAGEDVVLDLIGYLVLRRVAEKILWGEGNTSKKKSVRGINDGVKEIEPDWERP